MHPILFSLFGFEIPSYGVFAALGIVGATALSLVAARSLRISADFVLDAIFWCIVAGFAGARFTYLVIEWRHTLRDPVGSIFSGGGGVYLGGAIAGAVALFLCARRHKIQFAQAADLFAPALAIGHGFGRLGCYLASCCYGAVTQHRHYGVSFPKTLSTTGEINGSWPFLDHLSRGLVTGSDTHSLPVHPVQLYEAAANLLLAMLLSVLLWRGPQGKGAVALTYLAGYSVMRFCVEFLRGDAERGVWAGLSFSQWICLAGAAAAITLYVTKKTGRRISAG